MKLTLHRTRSAAVAESQLRTRTPVAAPPPGGRRPGRGVAVEV